MNTGFLVERRSGFDRRIVQERRQGADRRTSSDRRNLAEQDAAATSMRRMLDRRAGSVDLPFDAGNGGNGATAMTAPSQSALACELLERIGTLLTDVATGFYDAGFDPRIWPDVLGKLRGLVHADVCAVASHEYESGRGHLEHSVGIDALYVSAYADFYARDNIWLRDREKFSALDAVWASQDLLADVRLVETDFYKFWLRPQELFHHLFGVLDIEDDRVVYLYFARSRKKGAFWKEDAEVLRRLLPTLRRGLQAGTKHQRLQGLQQIAFDTLDTLPIGVIYLSAGGQIIAANHIAREILQSEESLTSGIGGLSVKLPGGRLKLRDLIVGGPSRSGEKAGEIQGFSIDRRPDRQAISLLLAPVQNYPNVRNRDALAAVLFVADPNRPISVDPRRLTRIYGLSRAEARVAALLATGMRLDQVAQTLGLTYETVRKHLKQIFSKTGTDRQADLVRTLSLGPCGLRL
jgi:DNA-binding CsgD family transcriptional regulator/PAS domain-containing protein